MPKKNQVTTQRKQNTIPKSVNKSRSHRIRLTLQVITLLFLVTVVGGIFYFYHAYGRLIFQLQADAKLKVGASTEDTFKASQTSVVYDSEGNIISELKSEKDVYYLEYEDIPAIAVSAMVVSEDRNFLEHNGVDYLANVRAAIALIRHKGVITQGASTITQQLARSVFLTQAVTYERKIEEIFAAQELEKKYSKTDILEFYLNDIYFANGHYGIQSAAQAYFGEGVSGLSMSQIVFLCAIPNNPNLYNPLTNMDNTLKRRDRLLKQLYEAQLISQPEYDGALKEEIKLHQKKSEKQNYVETYTYNSAVRALMKEAGFTFRNQFVSEEEKEAYDQEYEEMYSQYQKRLYVGGYRIYTSINLKQQKLLQDSVDKALSGFKDVNDEGIYKLQGAAVCIDNDSGRVVAIVGGRDQALEGYTLNRGYQSYRQPGSSIKPLIVYTPAYERGYYPDSIVEDTKLEGGPKNSDGTYLGKIKLQKAVELSKNTVAWQLFEELTPEVGLSYLLNMNFNRISAQDYVPAAALGGLTVGVSPVEMAAAYAALENDGYYRTPTCIVKIMDSEGNELVSDAMETKQIYQSNAARMMTETLTGVIKNGTAKGLGLTNTVSAGKTGTTDDKKDGWFVGYTPYYTTSVWVGYDLPKSVKDLSGASYPGTIWHNYMEAIHTSSMTKDFELYDWKAALQMIEDAKEQEETETQEDASQGESTDGAPVDEELTDGEPLDGESSEEEPLDELPADEDNTGTDDTDTDMDNGADSDIDNSDIDNSDTGNGEDSEDNTSEESGESGDPEDGAAEDDISDGASENEAAPEGNASVNEEDTKSSDGTENNTGLFQ